MSVQADIEKIKTLAADIGRIHRRAVEAEIDQIEEIRRMVARIRYLRGMNRLTQDILAPRGDGERPLTFNNVPNE